MILNCRETTEAVSLSMDEELPMKEIIGAYLHLAICKWCRRYKKQVNLLERTLKIYPEEILAGGEQSLGPEARERIKSLLDVSG